MGSQLTSMVGSVFIISNHFQIEPRMGLYYRVVSYQFLSFATLRAKRATFTFWVAIIMPKIVHLSSFWKPEAFGQTVLPDTSLLQGQKFSTFWIISVITWTVLEHTHPVVQSSALDYLKIDNKSKADIDLKHERGGEAEEESQCAKNQQKDHDSWLSAASWTNINGTYYTLLLRLGRRKYDHQQVVLLFDRASTRVYKYPSESIFHLTIFLLPAYIVVGKWNISLGPRNSP